METNWIALIVAAVSTMAVGFVWYNPNVFGKAWMAETGMTEEKAREGNMGMIFGLSFVLAFLAAYFIHFMVNVAHGDIDNVATFGHGAFHAVWLGLLVSTPVLATNALFEQKSFKYIAINAGYWIVCFAIMGGIIKVWQ